MEEFEHQTKTLLGDMLKENKVFENGADKLTACAGVAFIKSSYPFYYGYELAESLCSEAKKDAKEYDKVLAPSCVMFHKVQDSFVEDFKKIEKRELTTPEGLSFKFGPYYLDCNLPYKGGCKPTVSDLIDSVNLLNEGDGNKIKSHIRQWISLVMDSFSIASQKKDRVLTIIESEGGSKKKELKELFDKVTTSATRVRKKEDKDEEFQAYQAYDLLSLASVKYQVTKSNEEDK